MIKNLVFSKGWYHLEQNSFRWSGPNSEILLSKDFDSVVLTIQSHRKIKSLIKAFDFEKKVQEHVLQISETPLEICIHKGTSKVVFENDFFNATGDARDLSFLISKVVINKKKSANVMPISKIECIPDGFDISEYVFLNGDKNIKTELQAVNHFLYGKSNYLEEINTSLQKKYNVLISVLLYEPDLDNFRSLLNVFQEFYKNFNDKINLCFAIRNNGTTDVYDIVEDFLEVMPIIFTQGENKGFAKSHNDHFHQDGLRMFESDFFIVMNDDIEFENLNWILEGIKTLENDEKLGVVGSSMFYLDELGFGKPCIEGNEEPKYVDGSILILRSSAFKDVEYFDENIEYFYFEDVDLSFKLKQKGYKLKSMEINHIHYRSSSSKKVPIETMHSIKELNRAKFFSKWSSYLKNKRELKNRMLLCLDIEGLGDLVDCFYPTVQFIQNQSNVDLFIPNQKINFLYNFLNVRLENNKMKYSAHDYDQIYSVKDINFSVPFHTLDLISSKLGVTNFDCNEFFIKNYISSLKLTDEVSGLIADVSSFNVIHLDSQRSVFQGRQPVLDDLLECLEELEGQTLLIGQNFSKKEYIAYEDYIKSNNKIIDVRDVVSFQEMAILIARSKIFFGIDSGPSHLAQLFNIPSFIIYGPIHPLTKIYRYKNSGAYFNNNKNSGLYHRNLQPSYYFDIENDKKCIKIDKQKIISDLRSFLRRDFDWTEYFDSLRFRQTEHVLLQMHNPLYKNRLLLKQSQNLKDYSDSFIR